MNRPGGRVVYCPVCCRILPALTALLLSPAIAVAQSDPEPAQDAGRSYAETISLGGSSGDLRGRAADWMIMPGGMYTLSAGLTFLTAPESPFDGAEMRLTDVVLSSLAARYAIGGRGEIALAVELLPKQPAGADESVWQRRLRRPLRRLADPGGRTDARRRRPLGLGLVRRRGAKEPAPDPRLSRRLRRLGD
jgi:hypothetical protein